MKKVRSHLVGADSGATAAIRPKTLVKQEFGRRVYQLMLQHGWNQSETAQKAGLTRDDVSRYIRAVSLPTEDKLHKLAAAFGVSAEDLIPNYIASTAEEDTPAFEMKISASNPSLAWIRVNRLVSATTATEIVRLLESDNAPNGERGG